MAYKGYKDKERRKAYNRKYQAKYMREYRKKLKERGEKRSWNSPEYAQTVRLRAMNAIGGPHCVNCGCDRLEILEINHIEGGGAKDHRHNVGQLQFYRKVYKDPDAKSKYNVLCRPCNALHYVQDILKIQGHTIVWTKPG